MQIPVLAICGPSSSTPLLKPRPRGSGKSLPAGSLAPRADQLVDVRVRRTGLPGSLRVGGRFAGLDLRVAGHRWLRILLPIGRRGWQLPSRHLQAGWFIPVQRLERHRWGT